MKEKILVVDDNAEIREIVQVLLSSEGYEIMEAANGKEALLKVKDDVDLIILDVMMPDLNGYQVCRKIREITNAPVLFLTAKGQDSDKTLGFSCGGDDYLTKPFSYNELNMRVKSLLRRYHVYQGKEKQSNEEVKVIKTEHVIIDLENKRVKIKGKDIALTDLEYEILLYLMEHHHAIISSAQLFEAIWHEDYYYGANNTIMVHIRNLRKKIEEDPQNPQIIKTEWGRGYYCNEKKKS